MEVPIIPFGKHKGKSTSQVLKEDPEYGLWIIQKFNEPAEEDDFSKSKTMETLAAWFKKQNVKLPDIPSITFGKHKGKSAADLIKEDPNYAMYILKKYNSRHEETDEDNSFWQSKSIERIAKWLEKQQINAPPSDIYLPYKSSGDKYSFAEVCEMFINDDVEYDDLGFYDKYGEAWETWKIKNLISKLSSRGYLEH